MDLELVQKRINCWQSNGFAIPLTCGNNPLHSKLEPVIRGNKLVLICKDCGYVQEHISDFFYNSLIWNDMKFRLPGKVPLNRSMSRNEKQMCGSMVTLGEI